MRSRATSSFCVATALSVQRCSSSLVARPPAFPTRSASAGAFSTTITRCPTATRGRWAPANPCQLGSPVGAGRWLPPPPAAIRTAVTTTARAASTSALNGSRGRRVGIEPKIAGIGDGLDVTRGRRDHRRVVRAQGERREHGLRQRRAQLRVRGDTADDGNRPRADLGGSLLRALDERAHDRALIARGEIWAPAFELPRVEVANGVQKSRLDAGEREVEPGNARN